MRAEYTLHALRKEAATFPFPRLWRVIRCGQHYITVACASIWTPRSADTGCDSGMSRRLQRMSIEHQ
eukprot:2516652-Rhodomonas_salina.1